MRAVLSIGSNMADRLSYLQLAYDRFAPELVIASSIYSTPPWGVEDQDDFLNAILVLDTELDPYQLLAAAHEVEAAAERTRVKHWGPRTLDVDIVQCSDLNAELTSTDPQLTLPHPWAHDRAFVLVPWLEVEPDAILRGKRVSDLVHQLPADNVAEVRKAGTFQAGLVL